MQKMPETRVRSLDWKDTLEEEMETHSSTLAWRIPRAEESGGLQSKGWQRVRHDWARMQSQSAGDSCFLTLRPLSLGLLRTPEDLPHHSTQKSFCLDSPVSHSLWRNPTQLFPAMPNNTSPWHLCQPTSQLPDPQNEPLPSPCGRGPSECCPPRVCSLDWILNLGREGLAQLSLTRMGQKYLWN